MRIRIVCVGRLKEPYFLEAEAEFCRRLGRYAPTEVVEVADEPAPESLSAAQRRQVMAREAQRLLERIRPEEYVIALDARGTRRTSEAFAARLAALRDGGTRCATFLIGGSLGLGEAAFSRAAETLSLSDMTLPHRIARLVLLEQVYRAQKINAGEPYHK